MKIPSVMRRLHNKTQSQEEFEEAYRKEYQSWLDEEAFTIVRRADMPKNPDIISSHVLFKWKEQGTPHQYLKEIGRAHV